jgi:cobalt/nickel transport system permease protein
VHIPDGWIDVPTSAAAAGIAAAGTAISARRAATELRRQITVFPSILVAYLLVAQLLVMPVGLGTGAHLVGTGLATLLVGPSTAIVCVAVVVLVQALVLADGGVTAIGLNICANGIAPALVAWACFRLARRLLGVGPAAAAAGGLSALAAGLSAAAIFTVGGTPVVPATTVVATIGGAHVVVAILEGLITAAVVGVVVRTRPDLLRALRPAPAIETPSLPGRSAP